MKNKKMKILITVFFLFVFSFIGLIKWNKNFLLLWNANKIYVRTEKHLDKKKIIIEYRFCNHYKEFIFNDLLFDNGNFIDKMPNEYGENDFLITYDDKYYKSVRHFKTNRRHQHKYKFFIYEKQDELYCDVDIRGKNSEKYTFRFKKIE